MHPPSTPAVARALDVARLYAHGQGAAAVGPGHLLDALLEEEEGRAAQLAVAAGLAYEAYRSARGPRPSSLLSSSLEGQAPALPMTELLRDALRLAGELAVEYTGERSLSSEVVLLALVRGDPFQARRLQGLGLRPADLEAALQRDRPPQPRLEEPLVLADRTNEVDVARILDVGANRVREAVRVVEDYCRFVLDDAVLSAEAKGLRHAFTTAMAEHAPAGLLQARDTLGDVGTSIHTEAEQTRSSLEDVVRANLKRLEEALRSLEEFSKVVSPVLGRLLEQLRYRAYTLERAVVLGRDARERLAHVRLYVLLSGAGCAGPLEATIRLAAEGGAGLFQLREKALGDRELLGRARDVRRWTRQAGALFVVNDRPDVARLVEADGVHLGQDDMAVKDARRVLGPDALVGVSTHTIDQVRQAVRDGASYVGVGPTFPSATKAFATLAGLDFVREALAETTLPAFVIGGVNLGTVAQAVRAGARRVAVSQAVAAAEDPRAAAAALSAALQA